MNLNLCAVIRCTKPPFLREPLLLCREHSLLVSLNVTDRLYANAISGSAGSELSVERASAAPDDVWLQASHQPVVYFLLNGDRVKIGTSTNITARVGALSLRKSHAILLLSGDHELESALHNHFECDRIASTEWFVHSPRIQEYVARRKEAAAALAQPTLPSEPDAEPAEEQPISKRRHFLPGRTQTAEERILKLLADVNTLDKGCVHIHRAEIAQQTGLYGSTLDNTLSRLVTSGKAHRGGDRGSYGLGAAT